MGGNITRSICLVLLSSQVSFHDLVFFFRSVYSQGFYSYIPW